MPASTTTAPARSVKAETHEEFAGIRRDTEAARESADPKVEEAARLRASEVRQAVEGTTVEGVVQGISGLGSEISKALANASVKLVEEVERLEAEIAEQRAAWEAESRDAERERKQQEENLKKVRAREIEEHEYKKNLERKKTHEKYEEDQRLQEKKNKERLEELEKSWQQRAVLAAKAAEQKFEQGILL